MAATRRRTPPSTAEAAKKGDRRALLVAMRDRIAKAVDDEAVPARDLAALTKRLIEVVRDIEALDAAPVRKGGTRGGTADEAWRPV